MARLHHAAICVDNYDWYAAFFQTVFGFTVKKTKEAPGRNQLWFWEGIQLKEVAGMSTPGDAVDHLSIAVDDIPATVAKALALGCLPYEKGAHWFILPNQVKIELMELDA